mmetsp:Transcript_19166/g.43599  ORF Transcript_19166/g.43599 Transcript_19166/m.43599 type:complete len:117 (+) Transcript_19166:248-598(+)
MWTKLPSCVERGLLILLDDSGVRAEPWELVDRHAPFWCMRCSLERLSSTWSLCDGRPKPDKLEMVETRASKMDPWGTPARGDLERCASLSLRWERRDSSETVERRASCEGSSGWWC